MFLTRWADLAEEACCPNVFQHPAFILPVLHSLSSGAECWLLTGEDRETGQLCGLGLFEQTRASKALPLPHLVPMRSHHSYRDGLLVRKGAEDDFFDALLDFLTIQQEDWFGIELGRMNLDQPWALKLREQAVPYGCSFRLTPKFESPAVDLSALGDETLTDRCSSSRRKSIRKNRNRLAKQGEIGFQLHTEPQAALAAAERFLELEHASWKGERGTSLLSDPHETIFAREMLTSFVTRGNLVVSELTAGEQTAAVAINLKMGDWLYAFKIGWNDEFASASPGMLHELELVEAVRREMPEIRWIDSCAHADSYLSGIWPDRLVMGEGLLSVTTLARGTGKLMANVRKLKHWAAERIRQETPEEEVPAVN